MVTMLTTQVGLLVYTWDAYRLVKFFTNWCLLATLFSISLSLKCSLDTAIVDKKGWLAWHHFLFQITCPMNVICVLVYWSLLHAETITDQDISGKPIREFLMYANHITPFVFNWVNFAMTDVVMATNHWKGLQVLPPIYFYINYHETKKAGEPLYSFLTWEDMTESLMVCAALTVFGVVSFVLLASLTKALKPR